MNKINSSYNLMELIPQATVIVDVKSKKIISYNTIAKELFSLEQHDTQPNMDDIMIYTPFTQDLYKAVCHDLKTKGKSIIRHVYMKATVQDAGRYDIHMSYVDDTHTSVYLIFNISNQEIKRITQQNSYYNTVSDASYSYPFHLNVKTRRIEFFNSNDKVNYHMPMVMENFPEPLFAYNYICEDDLEEYKATIERMYKGEPPQGTFRFYDVKGELLRYGVNYVVNRDENGNPIEVNGDFVIQSTAQEALAYKEKLQLAVHECIDILFSVGATSQDPKVAYIDILNQVKKYYNADGAYFYKFIGKTNKVERVHTVFNEELKDLDKSLPMIVNEEELKLMEMLADVKSSNIEHPIQYFGGHYEALKQRQEQYQINAFNCISIKDVSGNPVGFMGIINPKNHKDNKEFMELLSRPICMFIEFQREQNLKKELLKLEASSKANVIKECVEHFREFANHKHHITAVLNSLCEHYDADVAVTLTKNDNNGDYGISNIGGTNILNFEELQNQPASAMEKWEKVFTKHKHFITDNDLDIENAKKILREKFGIYNFIASPIQNERGELTGLLYVMNYKALKRSNLLTHIVAHDISDYLDKIKLYEEKHLEPLTKLNDKVATQNKISEHLENGTKGALLIVDIDHFKNLNDTLGHQIGDKAIIDLANIIRSTFRNTDVIGRIGGDEFMVFCPSLTSDDLVTEKAQQLIEKCRLTYEKDGMVAKITASIGVCRVSEDCTTFQSIYAKADKVLYIAKKNGKNRYSIYDNKEEVT